MRYWRLGLLAAYVVALAMLLLQLVGEAPVEWAILIICLVVGTAPIAMLCFGKRYAAAKGVAALVIGGAGLYLMYLFTASPGAGWGIIFVPIYQTVAAGVVLVGLGIYGGIYRIFGKRDERL